MSDEFDLLIDPEWADGEPPFEAVVGVWADGRFRSNPEYRPRVPESPSDPIDAVLRVAADGEADPAPLQAVLRESTFELATDGDGSPLVAGSPDGPGVVVATSAPHRRRVTVPGWRLLGLDDLLAVTGGEHDVLINPGGPAPARLSAAFLRVTAAGVPETVSFLAVPPAGGAGPAPAPPVVDETAGGVLDHLDLALLEVLDLPHTAGVWRCWRVTTEPDDRATAIRLYLVETTLPDGERAAVAARGRRALAAAGHAAPVEVYRADRALPDRLWAARSASALIWAPEPAGEIRVAVDSGAEATLADEEILPFVTYLRSAPALTAGLHSDGEWVWPAGFAGRALEEGTLADPDLLRHLRRRVAEPREPAGSVALHRALVAVTAARPGGYERPSSR